MSFGSTFPLEIYEHIIYEIDDKKTLQNCLFVSWAFRHLARRHLFHEVSLLDDPNSALYEDAHPESNRDAVYLLYRRNLLRDLMRPSLLTTSASGGRSSNGVSLGILPYVRSVKYTIDPHDDILEEYGGAAAEAHYVQYLSQMEATAEVLELLSEESRSQVRTLHIYGLVHNFELDHRARWEHIIRSLRQSIVKLCHAPNIQIIYMVYMHNVPRNIFCGSPVKRLVTKEVRFSSFPQIAMEDGATYLDEFPEYEEPEDSGLLGMPHLQSFSARNFNGEKFYPEVYPPSDSTDKAMKAMSLEISTWPDDLIKVLGVVTQRFLKLERLLLIVNIWKFKRNPNIQCPLRQLTNLKFLTVQYNLRSRPKRQDRSFGKLFPNVLRRFYFDLLKHFKSTSILEITFNCTVFGRWTPLVFVVDTSSGELASGLKAHRLLDALISNASAFPSLRRFNLNFRVENLREIQVEPGSDGDEVVRLSDLVASNAFPSTKARSDIELVINPSYQFDQFLDIAAPNSQSSTESSINLPTLLELCTPLRK